MRILNSSKIVLIVLLLLGVVGCDSIFDIGDTEKKYDGPPQVEFFPLSREVRADSVATRTTSIAVQLIAPHRTSNLDVNFSVDGNSTAVQGTHYTIQTGSPVTISAGTSKVDIIINLLPRAPGTGTFDLYLNLDGTSDPNVQPAENLKQCRISILPPLPPS